ncbi:MAG TPA: enoyl-CoA hydratase/isomerase family protein [Myxococcota bacterium]|jgi:enoyl-CoA hydratase/carnithine racemase
MAYSYKRIGVKIDGGVAFATLNNPPINLITLELSGELMQFAQEVASDEAIRAVVLRSDDPDFWLAHFDVAAIVDFPTDGVAPLNRGVNDNWYHAMCETYRTMPKATIAEINGRVGGGGSELAMSCDMRFGALGKTIINQPEVALGILPGGTGTQRMPRLIGRGRALEVILGCADLDAATAERWGYLNRALPPAELRPFVNALAQRIASFPAPAIAAAKRATLAADASWERGLIEESHLFQVLLRTRQAPAAMKKFLANGGQTREGEKRLGELCEALGEK